MTIDNNKTQVTWLKITMEITTAVHVRKALKHLITPVPDFRLGQKHSPVFHKFIEVALLYTLKIKEHI